MRVLIVDTCYPAFLRSHYDRQPGLAERSYAEQWRALMDTFFGTADSYSHYLEALGHVAHEVIVNCEPLQAAWAREHELENASEDEVLLRQVEDFRPDVVYVQDLLVLSDRMLVELRRRALLAGQIASPAPGDDRLRMYDLLLSSFPHFVERFRGLGIPAHYLSIGFDPRVLDRLGSVPVEHDVVFVGALNRRAHRQGNQVLARAARSLPVDIWGYDLRGWPPWSPLRRRYQGEAWGIDMFGILASSRTVLNRHIEAAQHYANNMRLYEATGVGSLLVTEARENLPELFEPGREVVTYRGADDLVDQVRRLLDDEDRRREIAAAGQRRTLRDHTYAMRMAELATILEEHLR